MSQHLHLYASRDITLDQAKRWCHARAFELTELPAASVATDVFVVDAEMARMRQYSSPRQLEHWSNWAGVAIWDFLVWDAFVCDQALVDRAIEAALGAKARLPELSRRYPRRDFTSDEAVQFLRAHIGCVVWGDNDGI